MQFKNSICLKKIAYWENTEVINMQPGSIWMRLRGHTPSTCPSFTWNQIFCFVWIEIAIAWDSLIKYGISRQITAEYWE